MTIPAIPYGNNCCCPEGSGSGSGSDGSGSGYSYVEISSDCLSTLFCTPAEAFVCSGDVMAQNWCVPAFGTVAPVDTMCDWHYTNGFQLDDVGSCQWLWLIDEEYADRGFDPTVGCNGEHGTTTFASASNMFPVCIGSAVGPTGYTADFTGMFLYLTFIRGAGGGGNLTYAVYGIPDTDWNCVAANTLDLLYTLLATTTSENFPATLTITPCLPDSVIP